MKLPSRSAQINLRVHPTLKAKLKRLANKDRRTLSSYIENLLDRHAAQYGHSQARGRHKFPGGSRT